MRPKQAVSAEGPHAEQNLQPKVLASATLFQQKQLQKRVEDLESEKQRLIEDYQRQLQAALRDKESSLQTSRDIENNHHKVESERDKFQLKLQQTEVQLQKLKVQITSLEQENIEYNRKLNEAHATARATEDKLTQEFTSQLQQA